MKKKNLIILAGFLLGAGCGAFVGMQMFQNLFMGLGIGAIIGVGTASVLVDDKK